MADLQAAIGAPIQRPKIIPPGKPMRSGDVELPQSRLTMGKNAAALRDSDVGDRPCTSARAACVGDVVRLVGLSRHDLNERVAVVVRINDRVSVELQDGRRLAIKPAKLQLVDVLAAQISPGTLVQLRGLVARAELNGRLGHVIAKSGDRWSVQLGALTVAVRELNLRPAQPMPSSQLGSRLALQRRDLVWMRRIACDGAACALARQANWCAAVLRQGLFFAWDPREPPVIVNSTHANLAVAPTVVYGLLAVHPRMKLGNTVRIHCIGATADFEGHADWAQIIPLLAAGGFNEVADVEITCVGVNDAFAAPWLLDSPRTPAVAAGVTVRWIRALYHDIDIAPPDAAILCHPGLEAHLDSWRLTMGRLFDIRVPVIVAGHSNFYAYSHDAAYQDVTLAAFGATFLQRLVWNPFCQAYVDETKGSLLAPSGKDHAHCNLAAISVVRGGCLKPLQDVEAVVDLFHYLVLAVHAQPSWFEPDGPAHRNTNLNLQLPRMRPEQRSAALGIVRGVVDGAAMLPTAADLGALIQAAGCEDHMRLGVGNW